MSSFISRLGNINPQILREYRGRLKPRSVFAAVGLSALFQLLLCFSITDGFDQVFPERLLDICQALAWIMPYALFALGGYYIVDDLTNEAKTGTLNFVRLSPRPAREILLGKLLGAPALPLLLVVSAVPLFVITGLAAGLSIWLLLSYGIVMAFGTVAVYTAALVVGLGSGTSSLLKQRGVSAVSFAGLCLIAIAPVFMLWNTWYTWQTVVTGSALFRSWDPLIVEWFYLNISGNPLLSHLFVLINLAIVSGLLWMIAVRKFRVPQSTLISKQLSYGITAYGNLLGWGFLLNRELMDYERPGLLVMLYACNIALFFVLIFALVPTRQTLLDWVNYRRQSMIQRNGRSSGWWRNMLWADGSPSIVAIAINFLIIAAVLLPLLVWLDRLNTDFQITAGAIAFTTISFLLSALTYAAIVQLIFSSRLRAPQVWAAGIVAILAIVPPIVLLTLGIYPDSYPDNGGGILWTFLGVPFIGKAATSVTWLSIVGLIGQLCFLGFVLVQMNNRLKGLATHSYDTAALTEHI
ncbi:MAG: hypothetical protein AAGN15_21195 [Cyanobacteria bacterium J06581_3]